MLPYSLGSVGDLLTYGPGEALAVGDASLLPTRIRITEPKQKPNSGTVEFWDRWAADVAAGTVKNAVGGWRKQTMQN